MPGRKRLGTHEKETMKRLFFATFFAMPFLFQSCSDDFNVENTVPIGYTNDLVAYPKSNEGGTRAAILENGFWEKWSRVCLASGDSIYTPWNTLYSGTSIPDDVRKDIKFEDGWNLIAHTVNGYGERGMNYLVFHNRYSGILKVFYNLEPNQGSLQNTAIWKLHFEQPQSMLAFSTSESRISSDKSVSDIYLTNISNDDSRGFTIGWNCFQTELAYDPDFVEGTLQIVPMSMTTSEIVMSGEFNSETSGTIISTTSSKSTDGFVGGIVNIVGKKAESWVGKELERGKFHQVFKDVIVKGAGAIVKSGMASVLGSFIGGFDKQGQTTQAVSLQTKGEAKLKGNIQTLQTGLVKPLSMSVSVKDVGRLGVWSVSREPCMKVSPYVVFEDQYSETIFRYRMYCRNDIISDREILSINPDLIEEVGRDNIDLCVKTFVGKTGKPNAFGNFLGRQNYAFESIGKQLYTDVKEAYENEYLVLLPFYDKEGMLIYDMTLDLVPIEIYLPDTPDGYPGAMPDFNCYSYYTNVFSVTVKDRTGRETVICHTFRPCFEWNYEEFEDKMYLQEYPTIGIGEEIPDVED